MEISGRCETVSSVNLCGTILEVSQMKCSYALAHMESLGPSRPMRTGRALTGSGLRNRFPELPLSGVKKPIPVAVGRGGCVALVAGCSSGGVRFTGGRREGNNSSISGTDPAKRTGY
jgi:hypothetical protein